MSELMVADAEYSKLTEQYRELDTQVKDRLTAYQNILDEAINEGIKNGDVHTNLLSYKTEFDAVFKKMNDMLSSASSLCGTFVKEIDEKDKYLY